MNAGNARIGTENERVHSFGRVRASWAEAAKVGAVIAANLREFGYGG